MHIEDPSISIFSDRPPFRYSNFGRRLGASIIDSILISIAGRIIKIPLGSGNFIQEWRQEGHLHASTSWGIVVSFILSWLYCAIMESSQSQATLGKLAVGIIVTDTEGERISFARATGRHFAKNISLVILFIGYLMMLWDDRKQTLHDKMAGTLVLRKDSQLQF